MTSQKNNGLISVIVPVYNVEEYIADCLDSILSQKYQNYELILVNDGSTDASMKIAQNIIGNKPNVKFINQNNQGVSSARNVGMNYSSGEYIIFVDADDIVDEELIQELYSNILKNDADISCVQTVNVRSRDEQGLHKNTTTEVAIYTGLQALERLLYHKEIYVGPWAKLYKKSAIEQELFDSDIAITEDLDFNYRVFKRSNIVCVSSRKLYFVLLHPGSATSQGYSAKRMQAIDVSYRILQDVSQNHVKLLSAARNMLFVMAYLIIYTYGNAMDKSDHNVCERVIRHERKKVVMDNSSRLRVRIQALGSYLGLARVIAIVKISKKVTGR